MSKLLVTGCLGFIGSYFCKYYLREHSDDTIVGLNRHTDTKNLHRIELLQNHSRFSMVTKDITDDISGLFEGVDYVVHFAAKTFVDHSIRDPKPFIHSNIVGTFNMLEEARRSPWIKKFIYISTDEVYGPILEGSHKETSPLNPSNPYSSAKAAGDMLALSYRTTYGVPIIITRTENNYGPYQHPQKVMPTFMKAAMEGRDIPLYGDGGHKRMWLYVEDHCSAVDFLLQNGKIGEIYHVAGEEEIENKELAERILDFVGDLQFSPSKIVLIPDDKIRPGHDRRYAIDSSKLKSLGWKPSFTMEQGFNGTFVWYYQNYDLWLK